jgi:SET domain-containing protein 6
MMYESQKEDSLWKPYFGNESSNTVMYRLLKKRKLDVLPRQFNTPMFWNQQDLKELEGTDIIRKVVDII